MYDVSDPESVKPKRKPSLKQLQALERARKKAQFEREYREWAEYREGMAGDWESRESDRIEMVRWSQKMLADPFGVVIFDTETTGLNYPEILDIALIALTGKPLLESKICPKTEIEPGAFRVHGLSKEALKDAPQWEQIAPLFYSQIKGRKLLSYNFSFDSEALEVSNRLANFNAQKIKSWGCLMLKYARWYGEWSDYWGNYKWQPLCGGDHSALGDCLAALEYLKEMAADNPEIREYKHPYPEPKFK